MSKNKLAKFAAMAEYQNVIQPELFRKLKKSNEPLPESYPLKDSFFLKGKWSEKMFKNNNPIVLELGCGKGEYTVELARQFQNKNFIGIDIKGARMYKGATMAIEEGLKNVAFLRTRIELIHLFFDVDEVDELWITFPDPQMKKGNKRLTSTNFLTQYYGFLKKDAMLNLKTDSKFLYTYTKYVIEKNDFKLFFDTDDLYNKPISDATKQKRLIQIQTYYEKQWLARGKTIKYIQFRLNGNLPYEEPDVEIEMDDYRSYGRDKRSELNITD